MRNMFNQSQMLSLMSDLELPMDKQIAVNHEDCPAGTDTKKRLYIKRTPEGVLMFCHHCQTAGFLRTKERVYRLDELGLPKEEKVIPSKGKLQLQKEWERGNPNLDEWNVQARLWWMSYEMTGADAIYYDVRYSSTLHRLIMRGEGVMQARGFGVTPKYLTYHSLDTPCRFDGASMHDSTGGIVVVEDLMSAYKCCKAGMDVLALLGTNLHYRDKKFLTSYYTTVHLWLDNDLAGQTASVKIGKELSGLVNVRQHTHYQPKDVPLAELVEFAKGVVNARH